MLHNNKPSYSLKLCFFFHEKYTEEMSPCQTQARWNPQHKSACFKTQRRAPMSPRNKNSESAMLQVPSRKGVLIGVMVRP